MEFKELIGKTMRCITINNNKDKIEFETDSGNFLLFHEQECCEDVHITEIHGDLDDLIGQPLLIADEVVSDDNEDYVTWSFYKLSTINGSVTIRWMGVSNGCYSERVSIKQL
jgi:hypothetical protein